MNNLQRIYDFMTKAGYYFMLSVDQDGFPDWDLKQLNCLQKTAGKS